MKIRFMCDASDDNDDVYIDNVKITGSFTASPNNYLIPMTGPLDGFTGIENNENSQFRVYPNPASNELNISIENNNLAELFIYDMQGKVIHHEIMNEEQQVIGIEHLRTGVYVIFIITNEETYNTKFIKK